MYIGYKDCMNTIHPTINIILLPNRCELNMGVLHEDTFLLVVCLLNHDEDMPYVSEHEPSCGLLPIASIENDS